MFGFNLFSCYAVAAVSHDSPPWASILIECGTFSEMGRPANSTGHWPLWKPGKHTSSVIGSDSGADMGPTQHILNAAFGFI